MAPAHAEGTTIIESVRCRGTSATVTWSGADPTSATATFASDDIRQDPYLGQPLLWEPDPGDLEKNTYTWRSDVRKPTTADVVLVVGTDSNAVSYSAGEVPCR
jgi:hypothetical protein